MKSKVEPGNEIGMCQGRFPYGTRHKKAAPEDGLPCSVKRSYLLTKSSCSSRAWPSVPQSTPQPRTTSTRPGSGPAATALGIGLPSPAARCVEVSTSRVSSAPSCRSAVLDVTSDSPVLNGASGCPSLGANRAHWATLNVGVERPSHKIHIAEHGGTFAVVMGDGTT